MGRLIVRFPLALLKCSRFNHLDTQIQTFIKKKNQQIHASNNLYKFLDYYTSTVYSEFNFKKRLNLLI